MGQVIDFAAKKKELEDKKKQKAQPKFVPAQPFSKAKEPPVQKQVVAEEQVEQQQKTADDEFDFEKIMKENDVRKDKHSSRRSKDNESVKRSYRLKSKREPQG